MNTTTYHKRRPVHPAKLAREKAFDLNNERHPAREAINKLVGSYKLEAVIEEDNQTITAMKRPGLISFLCTLLKDGKVISQGRGHSILGPENRFITRAVSSAYHSSIADAAIRATKVLGTFTSSSDIESAMEEAYRQRAREDAAPATERQVEYIKRLAHELDNETEREELLANIDSLSKQDASQLIASMQR